MFGDKYLWTKIQYYNNKITTNFNNKVPRKGSECICLLLIVIDSVLKSQKKILSTDTSRKMQLQNQEEIDKIINY